MSGFARVTAELLRTLPLPTLPAESDKNARGQIVIIGGGPQVPGAALLSAHGALRAGAGKLQIVATESYAVALAVAMPEARVLQVAASRSGEISPKADLTEAVAHADCVIVGPGMLHEKDAAALTARLARIESDARFLVDAAALTGLADAHDLAPLAGRLVMTPHAGEMATLLDISLEEVRADPLAAARAAATRYRAVVVMKGVASHIVSPDGAAWLYEGGCHGLGASGSGDVLAGIIGGLLARGAPPATAALWGVWLHGSAGEALARKIGSLGFLARELPGEIPALLDLVEHGARQ